MPRLNRGQGALAVTWGAERFQDYLRGLTTTFETDHEPLITVLGQTALDTLPSRVQRFTMRLMRFSFRVKYVPGKDLIVADVLSRSPRKETGDVASNDILTVGEVRAYSEGVLMALFKTANEFDKIREAQA